MDFFNRWFLKSESLNFYLTNYIIYKRLYVNWRITLVVYLYIYRYPYCHLLVALGIPLSENIALNTFYTRMHTNNNSAKIKIKSNLKMYFVKRFYLFDIFYIFRIDPLFNVKSTLNATYESSLALLWITCANEKRAMHYCIWIDVIYQDWYCFL